MKPESIEEILYEMRDAAYRNPDAIANQNTLCPDWYYNPEVQDWLTAYADRIEAALQREKAKIESDVMEQVMLNDAARNAIKFDKEEVK